MTPVNNENVSILPQKYHLETVSDKFMNVGVGWGKPGAKSILRGHIPRPEFYSSAQTKKINPKLHSKHITHQDVPFCMILYQQNKTKSKDGDWLGDHNTEITTNTEVPPKIVNSRLLGGAWCVWRELKLISRFVTLARFTYIQVIYPIEGPLTHQGSK